MPAKLTKNISIVHHKQGVAVVERNGNRHVAHIWSDVADWRAKRPAEWRDGRSTPYTREMLQDLIDALQSGELDQPAAPAEESPILALQAILVDPENYADCIGPFPNLEAAQVYRRDNREFAAYAAVCLRVPS